MKFSSSLTLPEQTEVLFLTRKYDMLTRIPQTFYADSSHSESVTPPSPKVINPSAHDTINPVPTARIKTLPPSVIKDIEQKNLARKLSGLSPIVIRVRRCLTCGGHFESSGNRTCGCSSRAAGTIAGREII